MSKKKNKKGKKSFNPLFDILKREEEIEHEEKKEVSDSKIEKKPEPKKEEDSPKQQKAISEEEKKKIKKEAVCVAKKEAAQKVTLMPTVNKVNNTDIKKEKIDLRDTDAFKEYHEFRKRVFGF